MSSSRTSLPLYQNIAHTIAERITTGQYRPGERIPAIRQFAAAFGCNKLTVQKAFERLKQDGLIENRVGSGSFVKFPEKILIPDWGYDFKTDYIAESLFPFQQVQVIFNELFEREKAQALSPPPVEGDPDLIQVLSQLYHVPAQRMVMISGAQQGLDLVSKVFSAKINESILFEDPTYPGAIALFKAKYFVPLNNCGPDMEQLDRQLSDRIRLFYTMPSVHNPTGIAYSKAKKEAIARRAYQHPFYIIEDDYLAELRENSGPRFMDICPERTIYIKSLSQTTMAGIRLGFMVVPEDLLDKFVYAKFSSDIASFGLLQKFVREFIKNGYYQAHLHAVRKRINQRRPRLKKLVSKYTFLSAPGRQAGYNLWVRSQRSLSFNPVPWSRGQEFSFSPKFQSFLRLSFMHMDDDAFDAGLLYLDRLWRKVKRVSKTGHI